MLLLKFADGIDHRLLVGKLTRGKLGIDQFAIHSQFKTSTTARNQCQALDRLLVGGQEFVRQTDGARLIASLGAVRQFKFHLASSALVRAIRNHILLIV